MDENILRSEEIRRELYNLSDDDNQDDNNEVIESDMDWHGSESDADESTLERNTLTNTTASSNVSTYSETHDSSNEDIAMEVGQNCSNDTLINELCPNCSWYHKDNFIPNQINFDHSKPGLLVSDELNGTEWREIDIFHLIFDFDFVSHIAEETNRYYLECCKGVLSEHSKLNKWKNTNADEMYCFFATTLLMSHCKKNSIKQYWSTDRLIETPIFSKLFTQDRYLLIRRCLHFDNNCNSLGGDKLFKIRTVINTLRNKFSSLLYPYQNLVIDESLMLWKGRLSFKQYLPNKRKRFGIKTFILCDCHTGMILDFIVYTGKGTDIDEDNFDDSGISAKIVKTLMRPYLNDGHVLYTDNWYSSPALFSWLFDRNTGACGTVNPIRKNLPCLPKKMNEGNVVVRHNDNMLAVKWCDKRPVTVLSTVHKHEMLSVDTRSYKNKLKPKCIVSYNENMGAVDISDMLISYNDCTRKTIKWYSKLFFHFLDISVLNAFYIFRQRARQANPNAKVNLGDFRIRLIRQLLDRHLAANEQPTVARPVGGAPRLSGRHFMQPLPLRECGQKRKQRKCFVCAHTVKRERKRKDTGFECKQCQIPLCVFPCYEEYHTIDNF